MRTTLAAEGSSVAEKQTKATVGEKRPDRSKPFPDWVETAFRLYCRGQRNYSELGKQFGVDRRTVQANLQKWGASVDQAAEAEGLVGAYLETVIAYEEIIAVAWRDHAACGDKDKNAKAAFLKVVQSTVEKLAALRGVATQRVVIEHEMPKPLDDHPLELLVRIAQNGDGHAEENDGE